MAGNRPSKRQRRTAAAKAAALSQSQTNGNGGGPSTVLQQPLPHDAIPKSTVGDGGSTKAQETMKEETPEPMVMDRDIEDITKQVTESELDSIEAGKDGPITMLRLANDIAVLTELSRKLTRENSTLRHDLEKEVESRAEYSRMVDQELRVYCLGIQLQKRSVITCTAR